MSHYLSCVRNFFFLLRRNSVGTVIVDVVFPSVYVLFPAKNIPNFMLFIAFNETLYHKSVPRKRAGFMSCFLGPKSCSRKITESHPTLFTFSEFNFSSVHGFSLSYVAFFNPLGLPKCFLHRNDPSNYVFLSSDMCTYRH